MKTGYQLYYGKTKKMDPKMKKWEWKKANEEKGDDYGE